MHIASISIFASLLIASVVIAGLFTGLWKIAWLKLRHAGSRVFTSNATLYDGELRLTETNAALENNSIRDDLTGLYNRRHFFVAFEMEWIRAARDGHRLAVLMIDIDDFQLLTETRGHAYTDRLVRQIAHNIGKGAFRKEHIAAYIDPGRFALILPGAHLSDSHELAESISTNIPRIPLPDSRAAGPLVAVSIGGSCCIPQYRGSPAKMLQEADLALIHARAHSTNQVWLTPADQDAHVRELSAARA